MRKSLTYYFNVRTGQSQWNDPRVVSSSSHVLRVDEKPEASTTTTAAARNKYDGGKQIDLEPIQNELDEIRRDVEHLREEVDVRFVEARQERNMIRKSQRVMGNQHDSSISLFQSTLMTHATYVGEMEERRVITEVMEKMISKVESEALRGDVQSSIESSLSHHENKVREILRIGQEEMEKQKETMSLCSKDRDEIMNAIEDVTSKLRKDMKTLRDEHRVETQDMCKRTSSLEEKVSRHETRLDRESVTSIVESKLIRPVVRSFEMEERANRVLKSCQETCVREIETRIKQVRKTILREVEDMEKNKEKYWHDELIHAQAFLDGLPLPVRPPPVEDSSLKSAVEDSLKCTGPVVSVENIFPDDGS